jgi:hypothetical protein
MITVPNAPWPGCKLSPDLDELFTVFPDRNRCRSGWSARAQDRIAGPRL